MEINKGELDRHITGNYGEDQFDENEAMTLSEQLKDRLIGIMEIGRLTDAAERLPKLLEQGRLALEELKEIIQLEAEIAKLNYIELPNENASNVFEAYLAWKSKATQLQVDNAALQKQVEELREAWIWNELKFKRVGNRQSAEYHIDSCLSAVALEVGGG